MDDADAPRGVNMSLDDIIKENSKEKRLQNRNSNKGQLNGKSSSSRGRGRGGRGMGRAGGRGEQSYGRGGRGQQQAAQNYPQGYDQGFVQPERVVVVQEEVPDTAYRQVSSATMQLQSSCNRRLRTGAVMCSFKTAIEMNMAMSSSLSSTPSWLK